MAEETEKEPAPPAPEPVPPSAAEVEDLRKRSRERDEYLNDLKRVQADFLNYQKRSRQDRESWGLTVMGNLLRDVLPALDSFDLAVAACAGVAGAEKFIEGLKIAEREVFRAMENHGLKAIETKGKTFDPHEHEVVGVVETADAPDQSILEEVRKGYRLAERVLRPAQVRVARAPSQPASC